MVFGFLRKPKHPTEMEMALGSQLIASENTRPQSSQDRLDESLGINPYLLADAQAVQMIRSLGYIETTEGGKKVIRANPKFIALGIEISHIPRASWMGQLDAEIGIRNASCVCRRIKMKMSEDEYEAGGALVVDSVFHTLIVPGWLGAVDGRIAKLTKVSPKTFEVTYSEAKGKKEGFMP